MCNLRELAAGDSEEFVRAINCGNLRDGVAGFGEGVVIDHETPAHEACDFAASGRNVAQILGAVVIGNEVDEFAVGRETRHGGHAIKAEGHNVSFATCGRGYRDVLRGVIKEL